MRNGARNVLAVAAAFAAIGVGAAQMVMIPARTPNMVLKFDGPTGEYLGSFGSGFVSSSITGMAHGPDGNAYLFDLVGRVLRFDPYTGEYLGSFGTGFLPAPAFGAFGPDGTLYVGDIGNPAQIVRFDPTTGEFKGAFGSGFIGNDFFGSHIAVSADGTMYVANAGRVTRFDPVTGEFKGTFGNGFLGNVTGIDVTAGGTVLVSNSNPGQVLRFNGVTGEYLGLYGFGFLTSPWGVTSSKDASISYTYTSTNVGAMVLRFDPMTGEYLGNFAHGFVTSAFGLAVERAALVQGKIDLQDYVGDYTKYGVTIEVLDGSNVVVDSGTVALDASGNYSFLTYLRGSYKVAAKSKHWLRSMTSTVVIDKAGLTQNFSLINGDVDDDNSVTVFDYAQLSDAFDTVPGDPAWNQEADLDGDEAVTVFDYAILSNNFDLSGD